MGKIKLNWSRRNYLKRRTSKKPYNPRRFKLGTQVRTIVVKKIKMCGHCRKRKETRTLLSKKLRRIIQRCTDKRVHKYEYYGGRGIKCFLSVFDLEILWERDRAYNLKKPSIDRVSPNGNYEYSNCRFIEMSENNKRRFP